MAKILNKDTFIGNIFDPSKRGAARVNIQNPEPGPKVKGLKIYSFSEKRQWLENYLNTEVHIGPPMATKTYSVEDLTKLNYVGIYHKANVLFEKSVPNVDVEIEFSRDDEPISPVISSSLETE